MDVHTILHLLRNPYGYSDELLREARLQAADMIEAGMKPAAPARPAPAIPDDLSDGGDCD